VAFESRTVLSIDGVYVGVEFPGCVTWHWIGVKAPTCCKLLYFCTWKEEALAAWEQASNGYGDKGWEFCERYPGTAIWK
jgi:hypothetical protein